MEMKDPNKNSIRENVRMMMINRNMRRYNKQTSHNHGFSYVFILKGINILVSVLLFLILFFFELGVLGIREDMIVVLALVNFLVCFISYWMLTLPVKLFENIAIIAKNSTEILNKLK